METVKKINGEDFIIPPNLKLNQHRHREKENWINLWFFKNRKKTKVDSNSIKCDKIITSKLEYQSNIFYKMSQMSREDMHFNYYFRIKDDIDTKNIVKKNSRYKKGHPAHKFNKKRIKNIYVSPPLKIDDDGKFIVTFC
jgi:hypothetical protein